VVNTELRIQLRFRKLAVQGIDRADLGLCRECGYSADGYRMTPEAMSLPKAGGRGQGWFFQKV
jgi:hypothetical protein